jgi:hypothetical protein
LTASKYFGVVLGVLSRKWQKPNFCNLRDWLSSLSGKGDEGQLTWRSTGHKNCSDVISTWLCLLSHLFWEELPKALLKTSLLYKAKDTVMGHCRHSVLAPLSYVFVLISRKEINIRRNMQYLD